MYPSTQVTWAKYPSTKMRASVGRHCPRAPADNSLQPSQEQPLNTHTRNEEEEEDDQRLEDDYRSQDDRLEDDQRHDVYREHHVVDDLSQEVDHHNPEVYLVDHDDSVDDIIPVSRGQFSKVMTQAAVEPAS